MNRNILLLLITVVLFSSVISVSAYGLSSGISKDYQKTDKFGTISLVENNIFSADVPLADYTLEESSCSLIECYAIGTTTIYVDGPLFQDIKVNDLNGKSQDLSNLNIYLKQEESYSEDVPDYKEVCVTDPKNDSQSCSNVITGYHADEKIRQVLKQYNTKDVLPAGTYEWEIKASRKLNEKLDWVVTAYDQPLDEWAWWNTTWDYKKQVNITENSGNTLTNYAVRLNVTYNAHMQSNFNDLRFANSSETGELSYWIESYVTSSSAIVWVKIPSITASTIYPAYMYYGNSLVGNNSNGFTTFSLYDDFNNGATINSTLWQTIGSPNQVNGLINLTAATALYSKAPYTYGQNYELFARMNYSSGTQVAGKELAFSAFNGTGGWTVINSLEAANLRRANTGAGTTEFISSTAAGTTTNTAVSLVTDLFNTYAVDRNSTTSVTARLNTTILGRTTTNIPSATLSAGLANEQAAGQAAILADWIAVRPYREPEPTGSFGIESNKAPAVTLNSPANGNVTLQNGGFTNVTLNSTTTTSVGSLSNVTVFVWGSSNALVYSSTQTITGSSNTTTWSPGLAPDSYHWNVLGCSPDTGVTCAYAATNGTFSVSGFVENSQTYNSNVSELTLNPFSINLTYSTSDYPSISASLVYNGTSYAGAQSGSNPVIFSASALSPNVASITNVPFYWTIYFANSTSSYSINSSFHNQSVNPIGIDDCSVYTNKIVNFTNYDEDSLAPLLFPTNNNTFNVEVKIGDPTLSSYSTYSTNKSNVNSISICLQTPPASTNRMDLIVQYLSTGHATEFYNIQNYSLSNTTMGQNISLYDLSTTNANYQPFLITIKDTNYLPLQGVLVEIDRKYIQNGNYLAVEIPKTDSQGTAVANLVTNNVLYNIYVKKDGQLLATYQDLQMYCTTSPDCTLSLNLPGSSIDPGDFATRYGVYYSPYFNETTSIYYLGFISQDGTSKTLTLTATLSNPSINTTICTQTLTGTSGTLTCPISSTYQNITALVQGYVGSNLLFQDYVAPSYSRFNILSKSRYVLAAFLIMLFVLMAGSSVGMATMFFIIGLIFCVAIYLVDTKSYVGPGSFIVWFCMAACIILWKIYKGVNNHD